jgi:outer membrane protein TolC
MTKRILYSLYGILLAVACTSAARAQEIYSLGKCIETGLERNYSLRIVRNEQRISDNDATPGHAGYLPSADVSGGFSGNRDSRTANAGLNVNWTVFDGFGIQAEYGRLKELQRIGELNTRQTIEDFIAGVAGEYYNLVRQKIRLQNLTSTLNLSRERLRIAQERLYVGNMSPLDVRQAQVDFNADSSAVLNQLEVLHRSRTHLNRLMAMNNVEEHILQKDSVIYPNPFLDEVELWKSTMENNVSLLIAEKNQVLSELDLRKAKSRNYPYLRLNAGYGYTGNWYEPDAGGYQHHLGFNYGVTAGISLFDGFNRRREQRNARIRIENRQLYHQDLELTLRTDMSNQWMAYENNLNLWALEKENVVVAKEYYRIAMERYRLGEVSGIQLREAQNNLLNAEERQSIAEYATKLCEISLLQLSGQITSFLDPEPAGQ